MEYSHELTQCRTLKLISTEDFSLVYKEEYTT